MYCAVSSRVSSFLPDDEAAAVVVSVMDDVDVEVVRPDRPPRRDEEEEFVPVLELFLSALVFASLSRLAWACW